MQTSVGKGPEGGSLRWHEAFVLHSYVISGALFAPVVTFILTPGVPTGWVAVGCLLVFGQLLPPLVLERWADRGSSGASTEERDGSRDLVARRFKLLGCVKECGQFLGDF